MQQDGVPLDAAATVRPGRGDVEVEGLPVPTDGQWPPIFQNQRVQPESRILNMQAPLQAHLGAKLKQRAGMPEWTRSAYFATMLLSRVQDSQSKSF